MTAINISLVDLPGFHTDNDADSKKVNDLVQKYIKMESTLVVHVCRGDQDYGSLLGNDFMRKQQNDIPRITVLTHCDTDAATKERLEITYNKATLANSSNVIMVDGRNPPNDVCLKQWNSIEGLQIGADALTMTLQDKVNTLSPQLVQRQFHKLQTLLADKSAKLEQYQQLVPIDMALKFNQALRNQLAQQESNIDTAMRKIEQTMCNDIRSIPLTNIGDSIGNTVRPLDEFDEFEIGDTVYYPKKYGEIGKFYRGTIKSITKDKMTIHNRLDSNSEETIAMSSIRSIDDTPKNIILEIQKMNENRGYLEETHTAPHPIIVKYAQAFAREYRTILELERYCMVDKISTLFESLIDDAIKDESMASLVEIAKPMVPYIKSKLQKIIHQVTQNTNTIIEEVFDNNNDPRQVNTANPHYLHDLYKKMIEQDTSLASDDSGAREIYHKIRAYLKVARKQVCAEATKRFRRAIALYVEKGFKRIIDTSTTDLSKFVTEPKMRAHQRNQLKTHIKTIKETIALIESTNIA